MRKFFYNLAVKVTVIATIASSFAMAMPARAALTSASDTLTRLKAGTLSDHTIKFITSSGVAASQTVVIDFTLGTQAFDADADGVDYTDVNLTVYDSDCSSNASAQTLVAASPTSSEWSAAFASDVLTFTSGGESATIGAGKCVEVKIGENVSGGSASNSQLTNGSAGSWLITIYGTFGDSGVITGSFLDEDQIGVAATIASSLTFDVGTTKNDTCDTAYVDDTTDYTIDLGTLSTSAANTTTSGNSTKPTICTVLTSNASSAVVTVESANQGLYSSSTSNTIEDVSSETDLDSNDGYGICVGASGHNSGDASSNAPTLVASNSDCGDAANTVSGFGTNPAQLFTVSGTTNAAYAEVWVKANPALADDAASDYSDTLTFVATGTF